MAEKILIQNRKALFDYEILERFEAGLILKGHEIKALRTQNGNLKGSYISNIGEKLTLCKLYIPRYRFASIENYEPARPRLLLLKKSECARILATLKQKGITCVPLDIHLKNNRAKATIAIARGRKKHDKRELLKNRSTDREIKRVLKQTMLR